MEEPGYNIIDESDLKYGKLLSSSEGRNSVYKAEWSPKGYPTQQVTAKSCIRFREEEARILAKLCHKNVIKFWGVVKCKIPPDHCVIVAEYAEKGSLYNIISKNWPLVSKDLCMKWAQEGAEALSYIHRMKYQHGDVKSPNFVLSRDDTLKIIDFGTAREHVYTVSTNTHRGSFPWMAPEVMGIVHDHEKRNARPKVTTKADVFSYAVVMWEMITGKIPHAGKLMLEIYVAVVQNKEKLEIPKDCPEGWACLLRSCWNPDYKQRPTMEQVLETLVGLKRDSIGDEDTLFVSPRKKVKLSAERDDVKDSADVANKEIEEGYQRPGKQEERPLPFHCVADTTSVPPGDRILIAELNLSLYVRKGKMRPRHLKVWRHHVFESIPLPTQTGGYFFKGKLRDESGVPIYFICFERTFEKCRDRFDMITNSGKDRPLYMQYVTVLEQDEGYGGPENGESEYKLKIDEHSEIWWA